MSFYRLLTTTLLVVTPGIAEAQQPLTLAEATARALERNHAIRIERDRVTAAEARQLGADGSYDLQFTADIGWRHHQDPVTSLFSGAPLGAKAATRTDFSSRIGVSQLFKSGAVASLTGSVERQSTDSVLTILTPTYITSVGVEARQPLFRGRGIDNARLTLRITALDHERSSAALLRQVQNTVSDVEAAYWTLVAARRDVVVRRASVDLADAQRADTAARIEARTLAAADLAQPRLEVERRRGDLLVAEEKALRAERALKLLLADGPGDPLWDVALAAADAPDATPVPVSLADALADAMRYRPELAERRAQVAAEEAKVAFARDSVKPRLDAYASVALRELAGDRHDDIISLPGLVPTLPNGLYPDASAGVVFDVPLGRRAARGALGAAAADHRQAVAAQSDTEDRIAAEVRNAATAIDTAARRLEAARAGLDAAGTQLRAEQDRFGVGASTNFFVLTRQNDLAIAQLAENSALTDYQKARSELARATGTLLRDRGIQLGTSPAER